MLLENFNGELADWGMLASKEQEGIKVGFSPGHCWYTAPCREFMKFPSPRMTYKKALIMGGGITKRHLSSRLV